MKKKLLLLAGLFLACVQVSHATQGLNISSVTNISGIPFVFRTSANEAVAGTLVSTAPLNSGCTATFEWSTNASAWTVMFTTVIGVPGSLNAPFNVTMPPMQTVSFWRWNIKVDTGNSQIPMTANIRDVDDLSQPVFKNNKGQDAAYINDDSMNIFGTVKPDRYQYQTASSSGVITISSTSQLVWNNPSPLNTTYSFSVLFATYQAVVDKTFVVIQTTGSATLGGAGERGVTLSATPTISTDTAVNGDRIVFECQTSSITFQDATTFSAANRTTALRLGASVRACGLGDLLALIYYNGFWREEYFINNINE